ncbi:MAG: hypothetical protein IKJ75_02770 [Clostridia bacterium]|nr:hypothetical protein [Clostridia bacterium]
MNKGRNLAILMCCLLVLSLLTLLSKTRGSNMSGVVDDVRYIKQSAEGDVEKYEFYFIEDIVMVADVKTSVEGVRVDISYRGEYLEEMEEYEILGKYDYYYVIEGTGKDNAVVTPILNEGYEDSAKDPHEYFTDKFFLTMIYGKDPFITIYQAVIVAVIAAVGGLIIGKAEELCVFFKREKDYCPKWEELTVYKKIGGGILAFAGVILVVFVII